MNDGELIRRYVDTGDEPAFEALVSRHRPFIRRTLFALFGGWPEEAEEAEQEVLIALSGSVVRFDHEAAFTTWLYRLVRNKGIDRLRLIKRRRHRFADQLPVDLPAEDVRAGSLSAYERRLLFTVLGHLKEEERSLILLKEIDGFSLKEAAELMGIPEGTAKSRLHRGRNRAAAIAARMMEDEHDILR